MGFVTTPAQMEPAEFGRELAELCGTLVEPDADNPGLWVWNNYYNDKLYMTSATNFPDEPSAWVDAAREAKKETMTQWDISEEDWNELPYPARLHFAYRSYELAEPLVPVEASPVDAMPAFGR